jgi:hypothetical protein
MPAPFLEPAMTFAEAARRQYRYHTFYTVFLVGPAGEREPVGTTQRKSGSGLLAVLRRDSVQERVRQFPGVESITLKKSADRLAFSNGWALVFGGTIRQEAE